MLEVSSYTKLCRCRSDLAAREMGLELEAERERGLVLGTLEGRGGWKKVERKR